MTLEDVLPSTPPRPTRGIVRLHSGDPVDLRRHPGADRLVRRQRARLRDRARRLSSLAAAAAAFGRELTIPGVAQSVVLDPARRAHGRVDAARRVGRRLRRPRRTMAVFLSAARRRAAGRAARRRQRLHARHAGGHRGAGVVARRAGGAHDRRPPGRRPAGHGRHARRCWCWWGRRSGPNRRRGAATSTRPGSPTCSAAARARAPPRAGPGVTTAVTTHEPELSPDVAARRRACARAGRPARAPAPRPQGRGHRARHRPPARRGRGGPARRPPGHFPVEADDADRAAPWSRTPATTPTAPTAPAHGRGVLGARATTPSWSAGRGVGTVTKPGLGLAVGAPAINPVPRRMILRRPRRGRPTGPCAVTLSVPGGEAMAAKTSTPASASSAASPSSARPAS